MCEHISHLSINVNYKVFEHFHYNIFKIIVIEQNNTQLNKNRIVNVKLNLKNNVKIMHLLRD